MGCKEAATDLTEEDAELCEERRSQRVRKPRVIYNAEVEYQVPGNDTDSRGTSATKRQKTHGDTQVSTGAAHDSKESQEDESVDAVEIKPKQLPCMLVLPGANMSLVSGRRSEFRKESAPSSLPLRWYPLLLHPQVSGNQVSPPRWVHLVHTVHDFGLYGTLSLSYQQNTNFLFWATCEFADQV